MKIKNINGEVILEIETLRGANLRGANLSEADLSRAYLRGASLSEADLRGASLSEADLPDFSICPEEGSFVAFKFLKSGLIAKLKIPSQAKRTSSLVGRKCRAEFAKIITITDRGGNKHQEGVSKHNSNFIYRIGEIVKPDSYDPDIRIECSNGIHFFMTRKEAENY